MTKNEFIETLRRSISTECDYTFVNETIDYYQNYIESAIRQGRTEEDVMNELGNPRLIAKSILASRGINGASETRDEDVPVAEANKVHINTRRGRQFAVPVWLAKVGAITAGIGIVAIAGAIAIKLLPVICVGILAILIYRFFRDNF